MKLTEAQADFARKLLANPQAALSEAERKILRLHLVDYHQNKNCWEGLDSFLKNGGLI